MPWAVQQFFDANGAPLVSGKLCVFAAGTSTLKDTFTTAALSVANDNPVVMNAGGWPSQSSAIVGIFLTPGESYKFVLKASNATTCVPDTGTTIWSVDNITAVPVDSGAIDIDGTAGEALTAGDVVYLSDGAGGRTVGRWYKADADQTYSSSAAPFIGMVPTSISSGDSGTIRLRGLVTVSGVTTAITYYVSATAGALTPTPPTHTKLVGVGYTSTSILLDPINSKIENLGPSFVTNAVQIASINQFRLTLTTGVPVTTTDVTAAGTLYWTPYLGNTVALYTGSVWEMVTSAQLSVAAPAVANQVYDAFVDYNDGTPQLLLLAWTNDTTRATALTTQDGIYVLTGDTQQRYVGTVRTVTASQLNDSYARRHVWNYYNRMDRTMRVLETANSWNYTTAAYQCANTSGTCVNQLDFVIGVSEDAVEATVTAQWSQTNSGIFAGHGIGLDSTTSTATGSIFTLAGASGAGHFMISVARFSAPVAVGRHTLVWLEISQSGTGTTTFYGDNGGTTMQSGIHGMVRG